MTIDLDELRTRYERFAQDERDSGFPYAHDAAISCAYSMPELIAEVERLRSMVEQVGGECQHGHLARKCGPCSFDRATDGGSR
jgi:hypothetical protein